MPVELNCPRCQSKLSLGDELAGQYTFCPDCEGRVWVPVHTASASRAPAATQPDVSMTNPATAAHPAPETTVPAPATTTTPLAEVTPPPVTNPLPSQPKASLVSGPGVTADPMAPVTNTPAAVPAQKPAPLPAPRRVAKFITADVAQSKLEVATDGQLPKLQLAEQGDRKRGKQRSESATQWRLVLLICGSLVATTMAIFLGPSPTAINERSEIVDEARAKILSKYIGKDDVPPEKYQRYLRAAFLAHSQGNRSEEHLYYRKVLHLLRAEHHDNDTDEKGITGQRKESSDITLPSDEDLENQLSILLNNQ